MTVDSLKYLLWAAVVLSPLLRLAAYFQQPDNWLVSYVSLPFHVDGLALGALIAIRFRQGEWRIPRVRLSLMTAILIVVTVIICHP